MLRIFILVILFFTFSSMSHGKVFDKNKCGLIQLTSNKGRLKAINFYKKLGFLSTHKSFKLDL